LGARYVLLRWDRHGQNVRLERLDHRLGGAAAAVAGVVVAELELGSIDAEGIFADLLEGAKLAFFAASALAVKA
jgi:hypothetical protein